VFMCFDARVIFEILIYVMYSDGSHRELHSFPTRRSSDLFTVAKIAAFAVTLAGRMGGGVFSPAVMVGALTGAAFGEVALAVGPQDRKSTRLNSSHVKISYAVFCLKKKTNITIYVFV